MISDKEYTVTHTVLKNADIDKYLTEEDIYYLGVIEAKILYGRSKDNKNPKNNYLVVNMDEPYADKVNRVIQVGELDKRY